MLSPYSKYYLLTWDDFQGKVQDMLEIIEKLLKINSNA